MLRLEGKLMPVRPLSLGLVAALFASLINVEVAARASDPCAEGLKSGIAAAEAALAVNSSSAVHESLACLLTTLKGLEARLATIESDIGAPPRLVVPHTIRVPGSSPITVRGQQ